jgi:hypothetical protein
MQITLQVHFIEACSWRQPEGITQGLFIGVKGVMGGLDEHRING